MRFKDTYTEELVESRRSRKRMSRFWAKLTLAGLVLTVGTIMNTEPQLGVALKKAGQDAIASLTGNSDPKTQGVRINRPSKWEQNGARFERVTPPSSASNN